MKELKGLEEITLDMASSMNEMGSGANRINETSISLDNISKKVESAIDEISEQID